MQNGITIDRETYRGIKKMTRQELQGFLQRYADNLKSEQTTREISLPKLREEIGQIKGIGDKRLDEIMDIIEKHIGV